MPEPEPIEWADEEAQASGLPENWREIGYDSPEYMQSADSIYHVRDDHDRPTGTYVCVFPSCSYKRRDLRAMFRHVHSPTTHSGGTDG